MSTLEHTVERIPHRDLRNKSAEILRRVVAGESFEITNHGEVVAVLSPPTSDQLWDAEVVEPVGRRVKWSELPTAELPPGPSMQEILDELREERL